MHARRCRPAKNGALISCMVSVSRIVSPRSLVVVEHFILQEQQFLPQTSSLNANMYLSGQCICCVLQLLIHFTGKWHTIHLLLWLCVQQFKWYGFLCLPRCTIYKLSDSVRQRPQDEGRYTTEQVAKGAGNVQWNGWGQPHSETKNQDICRLRILK